MCLLKLLSKWKESWGISLKAVHVHHQLRGKEADDDEAFVRRLCEGEGIVCQVFHEDVQGIANREKTGLEEAGRLARYRCFTKVCEEACGGKIALAHHQDDLAETMLHHLVRGTGIAGHLQPETGIRQSDPAITLSGKRGDSWHIWKRQDSTWRTDSSNLEDDYTRNRIRHHVLEELKTEVNPQAVRHMAQLSEELEEAREVLARVAEKERKQYVKEDADGAILLEALKKEPDLISRQIIHTLLKEISGKQKNFTRIHIEAVQQLWKQKVGARRDLPYEMQARRTYDGILLGQKKVKNQQYRQKNEAIPVTVQSSQSESFQAGDLILTVSLISRDFGKIQEKKYTKWFDYDRIEQKLVIRHRQPGDRICPF